MTCIAIVSTLIGKRKMDIGSGSNEERESSRDKYSSSHKMHASARACTIVNAIALLASVPVWIMARKVAVLSGGSENWDDFFVFLFGAGVLIIQAIIVLILLIILIRNFKKWTRREKWICVVALPLPVISTLLALAHSSPSLG